MRAETEPKPRAAPLLPLLVWSALLVACGSGSTEDPAASATGESTARAEAGASATIAPTAAGGAPQATARPGQPAPTSAPTGIQDAPNRFFVSVSTGNDNNTGKRDAPFATIDKALFALRDAPGGEIYVAAGTYEYVDSTRVRITAPVQLRGGYNPSTWTRDPGGQPSIVAYPSGIFVNSEGPVRIEGFTIRAARRNDPSSVAIFVTVSRDVTIENNVIIAGDAGDGERAAQAENGRPGADGNDGLAAGGCTGGISAGGGNGGRGNTGAGQEGQSVMTDSQVVAKGGAGGGLFGNGSAGAAGKPAIGRSIPGQGGRSFGTIRDFGYTASVPAKGGGGGRQNYVPSTGGAGGGGGGGNLFTCGGGGGGGGGPGADGGNPEGGQGGGASIGVLIFDSFNVIISNNLITTGRGGRGGGGITGGLGGLGGKAGKGGAGAFSIGAGGDGGRGGDGLNGSPSGGGGGGPTVGIAQTASSTSTRTGNTFNLGQPGEGGSGGIGPSAVSPGGQIIRGEDGEPGLRAEFYQAPP